MSANSTNKKIIVLISGNGSNLQALIDSCKNNQITGADIVQVISSKPNVYGLERAQKAQIPTHVHSLKEYKAAGKTRKDFDHDLADHIQKLKPDLIVLAGWMLILGPDFVSKFEGKLINLHPSLPGDIIGAHAIDRAYEEAKAGKRTETGIMVHYVIAEVDEGKPIASRKVPILENDSLEALEERIHRAEHELLPEATRMVLEGTAPSFK
ncbi:phosphoribosylglycinamide formyltransferase [Mycoemilia scoparia]|uniref:phosphoribosylglycinamide formyltransferase 1 n=1 Tax=Mycoemilia scoparia TaxID=417184 RepID=A0A9W7ZZD4_9FUNG|nr:phosphoribosylglycinamide formyltransferase [Mycoemilia scoparia]